MFILLSASLADESSLVDPSPAPQPVDNLMDVFGVFDYINPFACPINAFEISVLGKSRSGMNNWVYIPTQGASLHYVIIVFVENYWLCCIFWHAYDFVVAFVEAQCGADSVLSMETYRDMVIPMMRERCPGNRPGSIGCAPLYYGFILLTIASTLIWVWAVVVTVAFVVKWHRLRRRGQPLMGTTKQAKAYAGTKMQIELRPLTNGKPSHV